MKIGVDLTYIPRFKDKDLLAKKILSSEELKFYDNSENKAQFLASRFALKEAFIKSLEGSILGFDLTKIMTKHKDNGAIYIEFNDKIFQCSLSHENEYCIGVVLND